MVNTIGKGELRESRFGDVRSIDQFGDFSSVSLAKAVSVDESARAWRVTFGRLVRNDRNALNINPLFSQQDYSYTFGDVRSASPEAGTVPPRRSNPILGPNFPQNNADCDPFFAQVAFGMSGSASNRLLGHWPMMGGSIVVVGSYVEVFGGASLLTAGDPAITVQQLPTFSAMITPIDGLAAADGGELSLTQFIAIQAVSAGVVSAGLITNPASNPTQVINSGFGDEAMPCSVVFNTAPFHGWTARIDPIGLLAPVTVRMDANTNAVPAFTITDNLVTRTTTIVYHVTGAGVGAKTVAQMEALINTSALIEMGTTDGAHAAEFLFPGFTANFVTFAPDAQGIQIGIAGGARQGGAVYVPDFARRVNITIAERDARFLGNEERVPADGPPAAQIVWYNDFGQVVFTEFQGFTTAPSSGSQDGQTEPTVWRPVPAQAVMVAVYSPTGGDRDAFFHWRISQ